MNRFEDLNIGKDLLAAIEKLGFSEPTMIQAKTIPLILEGKDVMGESATGSGKTLAFACGIMTKCEKGKGIQALVLTPTRELAMQVTKNLDQVGLKDGISTVPIYGGVSLEPQEKALHTSEVVVATPGRLLDHLERRNLDLKKIKMLVLDEVDRMLDMGFIDDVTRIISKCPKDRQTLFFSATMGPRIRDLAAKFMTSAESITATKMVDPTKLKQLYYNVKPHQKLSLLIHLLENDKSGLVMVFCNSRSNVEFVHHNLSKNGIRNLLIHGGMSQNKRTKTIDNFNPESVQVIVCTDVAARGLHLEGVSHVYNYDIPSDPTDYVHRIGRTARAGQEGKAVNLLCLNDHDSFTRLLREHPEFKITGENMPEVKRVFVSKTVSREDRREPRHFGKRNGPRSAGPRGGGFGKKRRFSRRS